MPIKVLFSCFFYNIPWGYRLSVEVQESTLCAAASVRRRKMDQIIIGAGGQGLGPANGGPAIGKSLESLGSVVIAADIENQHAPTVEDLDRIFRITLYAPDMEEIVQTVPIGRNGIVHLQGTAIQGRDRWIVPRIVGIVRTVGHRQTALQGLSMDHRLIADAPIGDILLANGIHGRITAVVTFSGQ